MGNTIFHVRRNGQRVIVKGAGQELFFQSQTPEHFSEDDCFAAWAILPVAMASLGNIIIEGNGDKVTEENAYKMSCIWAEWLPQKFRPVKITFTSHKTISKSASNEDLLLFSGGVDATYNLLRRHKAGKSQTLLTIRGLDYKLSENEIHFQQLIDKTNPVAKMTDSPRIFVTTNIHDYYQISKLGRIGPTHGFMLASSLFLMGHNFQVGEISADLAEYQDFLSAPWGTNSVTNELFKSGSFRMQTGCLDVTRSQKLAALADSPEILNSVSCCLDVNYHPNNCGKCRKCVRTKCMFLAMTGEIPEIFADMSLNPKLVINSIENKQENRGAFPTELVRFARQNERLLLIPGLEQISKAISKKPSLTLRFMRRQYKSIKKRVLSLKNSLMN